MNLKQAGLLSMMMMMTAATAAWGQEAERFKDLGVQITSKAMQGTSFVKDRQGRDLVFTVMRGEPAKLIGFDVATGELIKLLPLEGAQGAWTVTTSTDGSIYVGSQSNGSLYRYIPGQEDLTHLGQVLPGQTFVWDLTPGPNGAVFGATYPGCQVFRYHPDDGFTDVGNGAVAPDENYGRGIWYDDASGKIYVGVGAHAHLIELAPETGERRNILPEKFADKKFVYAVAVEAGRVFGQITDGSHLLVMNQRTHEIEALLPQVDSRLISPKSPYAEVVYFTAGGTLYAYDLEKREQSAVDVKLGANIQTFAWLTVEELGQGPALVGFVRSGQIFKYHPRTGKTITLRLDPPGEPTPIQSIVPRRSNL
jgi:outer membrane protein assembly factor BamB